eukprot:828963_1
MAAEKSSGSASTASSSSSMGGLFGHYVPPTPQIQWERAGELLYFTGQWFDSKAVRHTYTAPSDVLYINPEDKIAVRTEKHQDIVTFSCDPCERDNGKWIETDVDLRTGTSGTPETHETEHHLSGAKGLDTVNSNLKTISEDTHSQRYIVFTRGTGESRQIYYSVEPHPSLRSA